MRKKRVIGCIIGGIVGGMMTVAFFLIFGPVLPPMVQALLVFLKLAPAGAEVDRMIASLISFILVFLPGAILGSIYGWHGFVLEEKEPTRKAGGIF